jgi:hypothetical protein
VIDQQRDIVASLSQRRDDHVNHVDAIKEVFAKLALRNQLFQIAARRGDDADVADLGAILRADLLDFSGFEESQQQALHPRRHLSDFVEENRTAIGNFQLSGLVTVGARKAATDVAEQFRFEQRFRNASAVHRHERQMGARTRRVNQAGHHLFADAAFSRDQNLGVRPRDLFDFSRQLGHGPARANHPDVDAAPHHDPRLHLDCANKLTTAGELTAGGRSRLVLDNYGGRGGRLASPRSSGRRLYRKKVRSERYFFSI